MCSLLLSGTLSCECQVPWSLQSLSPVSSTQGVCQFLPGIPLPVPQLENLSLGRSRGSSHLLPISQRPLSFAAHCQCPKTTVSYILSLKKIVPGGKVNLVPAIPSQPKSEGFPMSLCMPLLYMIRGEIWDSLLTTPSPFSCLTANQSRLCPRSLKFRDFPPWPLGISSRHHSLGSCNDHLPGVPSSSPAALQTIL